MPAMTMKRIVLALLLASGCAAALAQQPAAAPVFPLWPDGAPGAEKHHGEPEKLVDGAYPVNIHDPSLTVMRADPRHANGAAVVVVPGGGHRILVFQNEGIAAAKNLNRIGVSAFVLKYRLARDTSSGAASGYTIEGDAAGDLRRALRWVSRRAANWCRWWPTIRRLPRPCRATRSTARAAGPISRC
jgi:acetyl esterase/lipase